MPVSRVGLLSLLLQVVLGTIAVTSPLVTGLPNNTIPYFYANYGTIPYQKSLNYDLIVLNSSLCSSPQGPRPDSPTFLVVQEEYFANCSNTQQAMLAEHLGYKGIVISSEYTKYASGEIVMGDDGNGRRVHIVCLFIGKETEAALQSIKGRIQITCRFPLPQQAKSTVHFFLSASQRTSYLFLKQFREDYSDLQDQVQIVPVYFTFESQWTSPDNCFDSVYCSYDYDNFQNKAGRAVINTQLIHYNVLQTQGTSTWLHYLDVFDEVCTYNWDNIQQCHLLTRFKLGLPDIGVGDQPLETLRTWRQQEQQLGFETFPEVAINGVIFRGTLDYPSFKQALCQSIITPPPACRSSTSVPTSSPGSGKSLAVALAFLTLGFIFSVSFVCYRRWVSQEMPGEMTGRVNELVANYASLLGEKRSGREQEEL